MKRVALDFLAIVWAIVAVVPLLYFQPWWVQATATALFVIAYAFSKISQPLVPVIMLAALFVASYLVLPAMTVYSARLEELAVLALVAILGMLPIIWGWCIRNLTVRSELSSSGNSTTRERSMPLLFVFIFLIGVVGTWLFFFISQLSDRPTTVFDDIDTELSDEMSFLNETPSTPSPPNYILAEQQMLSSDAGRKSSSTKLYGTNLVEENEVDGPQKFAEPENNNLVELTKRGEQLLSQHDYSGGAKLISEAAANGAPAAQYRLAKLHERGIGVARDYSMARSWTARAAEGGNVRAMHDIAVYYADGESGAQSYVAAAEWFRKAADYGVVDSQFNLGVLYENGLGVTPSNFDALFWFKLAAEAGDASAPVQVKSLTAKIGGEQVMTIDQRVSEWSALEPDPFANGISKIEEE